MAKPPIACEEAAVSDRQPVDVASRGRVRPYTRRKDNPKLIPKSHLSEGEGSYRAQWLILSKDK